MHGWILKMENDITTIITEDNSFLLLNTLFIPVNLKSGDPVEIEDNKIVLR